MRTLLIPVTVRTSVLECDEITVSNRKIPTMIVSFTLNGSKWVDPIDIVDLMASATDAPQGRSVGISPTSESLHSAGQGLRVPLESSLLYNAQQTLYGDFCASRRIFSYSR